VLRPVGQASEGVLLRAAQDDEGSVDPEAPASGRPRRRGAPLRQAAVADPRRGTFVALLFPSLALALGAGWYLHQGAEPRVSLVLSFVLAGAAALAERIAIQLGPRSWYTASAPAIVLAGLLGGPLLGVLAGASSQVARGEAVWRRRLAEGGVGALQGFVAGAIGTIAWTGPSGTSAKAALALGAGALVNTLGRALIMIERRTSPFLPVWLRGIGIDVTEWITVTPILALLAFTVDQSEPLVAATVISVLAVLTIAQQMRDRSIAELAAEQAMSRRDQLTGAPNRRAFEEALATEHARIVRGGLSAGLFVIDVDRFKSINDRFGHAVGDEVIIAVVNRLTEALRPTDIVARWGGEELTVLAPGVRSRGALERVGEQIRAIVADSPLVTSMTAIPVTVSVGGTLLDGSVAPISALRYADDALYDAKRTRDTSLTVLAPRLTLGLESA
jgi:diguanylate cyclase (GGDEF)-like protein